MLSRGENKAMADARPGRVAGGAAWLTGRILPRLILARRATVCSARIAHIFDLRDTAHTANRERSQDSCINFTSLQYLWNFLDGIEINKRNSVEYSAKINNRSSCPMIFCR